MIGSAELKFRCPTLLETGNKDNNEKLVGEKKQFVL